MEAHRRVQRVPRQHTRKSTPTRRNTFDKRADKNQKQTKTCKNILYYCLCYIRKRNVITTAHWSINERANC